MVTVGMIGAGRMGQPMIGHLARKGHDVSVYDLDPAKRMIGGLLEGGAPTLLPAIADGENHIALADQILVERRDEAVGDVLRLWSAIDAHDHRGALAGGERRAEQLVVELGNPVGGGQAAEARGDSGGGVGRPRVRGIDPVLLDPRQPLAIGIGQPGLRRLSREAGVDDREAAGFVDHRRVCRAGAGQRHRLRPGAAIIEAIKAIVDASLAVGGEE